ncbi:DUF7146 domain-containing protein [Phaeobacter piscinae]|uniref:Conjugative transfer relaxase protein TraI n=1 Tax=Phaeobacter piscinae TaxID=1580596 RepID=A0AAN1GPL1_9RHOB|nr:toprim domain-containing protein [Phaeobacter piscinae]ATG42640.1 conjugative transfer relaxase protein TraI [Phaeobacter piscinae]
MDAETLTRNLGGYWRNGRGLAPCPVCQPERRRDQNALSVTTGSGKLLLHCFKSHCSFVEIAEAAGAPLSHVQIDFDAQREHERKQAEYQAAKLAKARSLWDHAKPIEGTKAETYLRARGITIPLPETLRFVPDLYHAPSASWACAMVADVQPTGGIHRTFFTKKGERVTRSAKMMLGPCCGGAVPLSAGAGPLYITEGIETGLSVAQMTTGYATSVWAALSTSGIKGLRLPDRPGKLVIASDGDDAGTEAAQVLASRAASLGWNVGLMTAPDGKDWNDVLQEGGSI